MRTLWCRIPSGLSFLLVFFGVIGRAKTALAAAPTIGTSGMGTSLYIWDESAVAIIPEFTGLAGATQFSVECWSYSLSSTFQPTVVAFSTSEDSEYWELSFGDTLFYAIDFNNQILENPFDTNQWHHLAFTVDATSEVDNVVLYVDGEVFQTQSWVIPGPFQPSVTLLLGKYPAVIHENSLTLESSLSFKGYIDELRIWSSVRTQRQIQDGMYGWVDDQLVDLVAQWHFDDQIDPPDGMSASSTQGLSLNLADIANIHNDPCGDHSRPIHSSIAAPLIRSWLDNTNGSLSANPYYVINYIPLSRMTIPLPATGETFVLSFPVNGTLFVNTRTLSTSIRLPYRLPAGSLLQYGNLIADSSFEGDVFLLQPPATSSPQHTFRILVRPNLVTVVSNATVVAISNKMHRIQLPVSSLDGDMFTCSIVRLPSKGTLFQIGKEGDETFVPISERDTVVSNPGCALFFLSDGAEWGKEYTSFDFGAQETPLFLSDRIIPMQFGTISIDVSFANHFPEMTGPLNLSIMEDSEPVAMSLDAIDMDGDLVSAIVGKLPQKGRLFLNGRPLTALAAAMNQTDAWVAEVLDYSTEYINPPDWYTAKQIIGEATATHYGDSIYAWCCLSLNFTSDDPQFTTTEFIHVRFEKKLYPREIVIYESQGPRSLVRVRTPDQLNPGHWLTLWMGTVQAVDVERVPARSITLCGVPFPIDELRLEFDTSVYQTWFEIDAVKLVGTYDWSTDVIGPPRTLLYQPYPLHHGEDSLHFQLTDCPGQYLRSTRELIYKINITHVNHPPIGSLATPTVTANQSFPVHIPLIITDVDIPTFGSDDPAPLFWILRKGPSKGTVCLNGNPETLAPINSPVSANQSLYYTYIDLSSIPFPLCGNAFSDLLVVQVFDGVAYGNNVTVNISGLVCDQCPKPFVPVQGLCQACRAGLEYDDSISPPMCVPIVISPLSLWWVALVAGLAGVVLLLALAAYFYNAWKRRKLIAQKLASVPQGECTFVFTDIQNSTHLWETYPQMPEALDIHNTVIRHLIRAHGGYEVKTIGDSFFIAFRDAMDAVSCAVQMQLDMRLAEWPHSLLFLPECQTETSEETGDVLWRGLRVRVGMTTGTAVVEIDPKTLRADYFGPTINFAALIESRAIGGQVLLSDAVLRQLPEEYRNTILIEDRGSYNFKGIDAAQTVYSVCAPELIARCFPKETAPFLCNRCGGPATCPKCDNKFLELDATGCLENLLAPAPLRSARSRRPSWKSIVTSPSIIRTPAPVASTAVDHQSSTCPNSGDESYRFSCNRISPLGLLKNNLSGSRLEVPVPNGYQSE